MNRTRQCDYCGIDLDCPVDALNPDELVVCDDCHTGEGQHHQATTLDAEHRQCFYCERPAIGYFNEGEFLIQLCRGCFNGEDPRDPIDILLTEVLPEPEEFDEIAFMRDTIGTEGGV